MRQRISEMRNTANGFANSLQIRSQSEQPPTDQHFPWINYITMDTLTLFTYKNSGRVKRQKRAIRTNLRTPRWKTSKKNTRGTRALISWWARVSTPKTQTDSGDKLWHSDYKRRLLSWPKRDSSPPGFIFGSRVNTSEELGARDTCVSPAHTSLAGVTQLAAAAAAAAQDYDQPISLFQIVTGKIYSERYPLSLLEGYSCRC